MALPSEYCCIDLETTGLSPARCHIIEISAVRVRDGEAVEEFTTLVRPPVAIPSFITHLTGISDEMVRDRPGIAEVADPLFVFLGSGILLGHNVHFDVNFLYDHLAAHTGRFLGNDFVDLLRLSRRYQREYPDHRLSTLAERAGVRPTGMHRARRDVEVTIHCYERIRSRVPPCP
jgi:DNA polymerase III epsilon subunit family exonuclease